MPKMQKLSMPMHLLALIDETLLPASCGRPHIGSLVSSLSDILCHEKCQVMQNDSVGQIGFGRKPSRISRIIVEYAQYSRPSSEASPIIPYIRKVSIRVVDFFHYIRNIFSINVQAQKSCQVKSARLTCFGFPLSKRLLISSSTSDILCE